MIQEKHRGQHAKQVIMSSDIIERMMRQSQFKIEVITIHLSSKFLKSKMYLCFKDEDAYFINKFPKSLFQNDSAKESKFLSVHDNALLMYT